MALAMPPSPARDELIQFLQRYGIVLTTLDDAQAVEAEIARRLYGTQRIYLAVVVEDALAQAVLPHWSQALAVNPLLGETPVAVLCSSERVAYWLAQPVVRYVLQQPPAPRALLKWLSTISRWRKLVEELMKKGVPAARLSRDVPEPPGH